MSPVWIWLQNISAQNPSSIMLIFICRTNKWCKRGFFCDPICKSSNPRVGSWPLVWEPLSSIFPFISNGRTRLLPVSPFRRRAQTGRAAERFTPEAVEGLITGLTASSYHLSDSQPSAQHRRVVSDRRGSKRQYVPPTCLQPQHQVLLDNKHGKKTTR